MKLTKLTDTIFTINDFLTRQECLDTIVKSEGSEVTQGVKYVLRSDVMYRVDS